MPCGARIIENGSDSSERYCLRFLAFVNERGRDSHHWFFTPYCIFESLPLTYRMWKMRYQNSPRILIFLTSFTPQLQQDF